MLILIEKVDKTGLIQPLINLIEFSNSRLKPLLIEQLITIIGIAKTSSLLKQINNLAFKLLDDAKTETKQKSEKLILVLYELQGQALLDQCPPPKLQRLCEIISLKGPLPTFGANQIQSALKSS